MFTLKRPTETNAQKVTVFSIERGLVIIWNHW